MATRDKPFPPKTSGNPNGRPPGSQNKITVYRQQLAELLPEAREQLAAGVRAGDPKLVALYYSLVFPPVKASYPAIPIDLTGSPRDTVTAVLEAVKAGQISTDHASNILDLLVKAKRIETGIALAEAKVIDSSPLETAQAVISTAVATGDLSTVMEATRNALPYTASKPQPEPPEPTDRVEAEPLELSPEEWEAKYGNNA